MIKRLNESDIEDLTYIIQKYREIDTIVDDLKIYLKDENNYTLVYEEDVIVGYLNGYVLKRFDGKKMAYIHEVHVDQNKRNHGIGTQLMMAFQEYVGLDVSKIFLITNKSNNAAKALYERCGYKSVNNDDLVYELKL